MRVAHRSTRRTARSRIDVGLAARRALVGRPRHGASGADLGRGDPGHAPLAARAHLVRGRRHACPRGGLAHRHGGRDR